MKKATTILNKIKTELGMKINLETAMLEDGVTTIEAEALENGAEVFIVMDEERVPLAIGEYTLEDGRSLVVEQEGVISMIGEKAEAEEEDKEAEEEEEELANDKPKTIVETKVKETYFAEEEAVVEDVVETIEAVEEEILGEVSTIIEELTPEAVTETDASEMAVAVVEAVEKTLEEMPEEMKTEYMKEKKKYGKKKMSESEAEIVEEVSGAIAQAVSEVVEAETPEEVTTEVAQEIAFVVTEAVQEIVGDAPEELKKQMFRKKEKLSKAKKRSTKERIALAKKKIAKLNSQAKVKNKPTAKRIKHNPEATKKQKVEFQISPKKPKSSIDRVMAKLYGRK